MLKIGSKVKLKDDLVVGKNYDGLILYPHMSTYKGKIYTVKSIDYKEYDDTLPDTVLFEENDEYVWSVEMIEEVN